MLTAPGLLIKAARRAAGLTQTELAARLGTSQPAVARLERPDSDPRVQTLNRAIAATGHSLSVELGPPFGIDETLVANNLRYSPAERLQRFASFYESARAIAGAARRGRGP